MDWQEQLKGNTLEWLLTFEDPGLRYLAKRDLLDLPADQPELTAARELAHRDGPISRILAEMDEEGFWVKEGPGYNPKYRSTVWALILLGQLGARAEDDKRVAKACRYALDHSLTDYGQFTVSGTPSTTADCLQGNLCTTMLELGYWDPRLETAFDWMARSVTGEGVAPQEDKNNPIRYYAGNCGPVFACGSNNKLPCAWGAAKVMLAFGKLPLEHRTPPIQSAIETGVEFLLGTDPAQANYPSGWAEKPSGNWWKFGFPVFYVTDILQVVEALVRLGYGQDPRLANAIHLIQEKQDSDGRWSLEYDYAGKTWIGFGEKKQPNPWVTLRATWVLKNTFIYS